jgi:carbamate kinase
VSDANCRRRLVVALGGNALLRRGEPLTAETQRRRAGEAMRLVAELARSDDIVLTHGNGPQVGLLALQGAAYTDVAAYPLDLLGAQTEGMIGYLIQQELGNVLPFEKHLATLLTQIEVDPEDPAFGDPTKPIGPYYDEPRARALERERGWTLREDAGRGWRRVVPSPQPLAVLELEAVRTLLAAGQLVIAAGGGGIPVVRRDDAFDGIDAVIDKDHASALLAAGLGAQRLVVLTQVPGVYRDFGQGREPGDLVEELDPERDAPLVEELAAGSMRPKVEAAFAFVRATGGEALITSADAVRNGEAGTRVVPASVTR